VLITLHRLQNKVQPLLGLYGRLQGLEDHTGENSLLRVVGDRDEARASHTSGEPACFTVRRSRRPSSEQQQFYSNIVICGH